MKTNVVMIRKMGQFNVPQRTQDGYFDGSELLRQWNSVPKNPERAINRFLESPNTKEFIDTIQADSQTAFMQNGDFQSVIIIKGRNTKNGRTKDQVWMHPYLFIDFAMWLNPKFKLEVIRFVHDQLIEFRHSSGDNYKGLTSAVSRLNGVNYSLLAKGLNHVIFGKHEEGLRQIATQDQLKQLTELQSKLAFAIDMGYIKSFDELINELRRIYHYRKAA